MTDKTMEQDQEHQELVVKQRMSRVSLPTVATVWSEWQQSYWLFRLCQGVLSYSEKGKQSKLCQNLRGSGTCSSQESFERLGVNICDTTECRLCNFGFN